MKFPEWVDDPKLNDEARARNRLRYLLYTASAKVCPRGSIKALSRLCGVDNSTLCYGLRKGRITDSVAIKLQDGAGLDDDGAPLLKYEELRFPLRIATE